MSRVHERVLAAAENIYSAAGEAFDAESYWWAELSAGGAMGLSTFLTEDSETPDSIRDRAYRLFDLSRDFASKARTAWLHQQTGNGLPEGLGGVRETLAAIEAQLDGFTEWYRTAIRGA